MACCGLFVQQVIRPKGMSDKSSIKPFIISGDTHCSQLNNHSLTVKSTMTDYDTVHFHQKAHTTNLLQQRI